MTAATNLARYMKAQETDYAVALKEIQQGRKKSHWMWYIFPQLQGLGLSETARYYALKDRTEAEEFLNDPVLGQRLIEISNVLLDLPETDAHRIFGSPDDMKLKSCMTLFSAVECTNAVFELVIKKFFRGAKDERTLALLAVR